MITIVNRTAWRTRCDGAGMVITAADRFTTRAFYMILIIYHVTADFAAIARDNNAFRRLRRSLSGEK
jgi:hypothetical protein